MTRPEPAIEIEVPGAVLAMKSPTLNMFPTGPVPAGPGGHPMIVALSPTILRGLETSAPHHRPAPTRTVSPGFAELTAS